MQWITTTRTRYLLGYLVSHVTNLMCVKITPYWNTNEFWLYYDRFCCTLSQFFYDTFLFWGRKHRVINERQPENLVQIFLLSQNRLCIVFKTGRLYKRLFYKCKINLAAGLNEHLLSRDLFQQWRRCNLRVAVPSLPRWNVTSPPVHLGGGEGTATRKLTAMATRTRQNKWSFA